MEQKNKKIGYYNYLRKDSLRFINFIENNDVYAVPRVVQYKMHGKYGEIFEAFIDYELESYICLNTARTYRHNLKLLNDYLTSNKLDINQKSILEYFVFISKESVSPHFLYTSKIIIRKLLKYMKEKQLIEFDFSKSLPEFKYLRTKELPSAYTDQEIKSIIESIDRNSTIGKRDYAMTLLAVKLGLRISDILHLKFENIDWVNNTIHLTQQKTQKDLDLPLLPDIGNAILDYLKNARRKSDNQHIFLADKGPIEPIKSNNLYSIISKAIRSTGIDSKGRKKGPHSLRHSLASKLLKDKQPLPIISEVLGHSSSQVTTVYLSIDYDSLKSCPIKMPPITVILDIKKTVKLN